MATMNKPAFNHIKKFSDGKPVIIFVSSRRQTRLTANDLISFSQMESHSQSSWVKCDIKTIQAAINSVHDEYLKQTLSFGIVMHHAGLDNHDRDICE
jgi:activating signal cointegrator complex subunit 3